MTATRYHSLIVVRKQPARGIGSERAYASRATGRGSSWACGTGSSLSKACSFTPESVLTNEGKKLVENFLGL